MIFKIVLMAKNWSKLRRRARPQREWAAGSTARSLQRHRPALVQAAELSSELENALCPIASTSLFHFQAVTRAEATISSISHLAYSKLEWVGFSLAYKWATGSRMSACWDYRLDIIEDSRAWPWNKVQGSLLGSYTGQRENWVHRNVMQISWLRDAFGCFCPHMLQNGFFLKNLCFSRICAWQGSLYSFKPHSCPCPKDKITDVRRRNPTSYLTHASFIATSVTENCNPANTGYSEQGWGTPFPFTEEVLLFRQYFRTWRWEKETRII